MKKVIIVVPAVLLIGISISAWFFLTARRVFIVVTPEPSRVSVQGGLAAPRIGNQYLLQPGSYQLEAERQCYQLLRQRFMVTSEKKQQQIFTLKKQPGLLSLRAHPVDSRSESLSGAIVTIDGKPVGQTPATDVAVAPGRRSVTIRAEHYLASTQEVAVQGCGIRQEVALALVPDWAGITIESVPAGAQILANGKVVGDTPATFKLPSGEHQLTVTTDGFKPWQDTIVVEANQHRTLDTIRLQPADSMLAVQTNPAAAQVMIGSRFAGRTPLKLKLAAGQTHSLLVSKPGYREASRQVTLARGESKTVAIDLQPETGVIQFTVAPQDSELLVDGKSMGKVPGEVELLAVPQRIEIRNSGYASHLVRITPQPGNPQEVNVALKPKTTVTKSPGSTIRARNGYALKRIPPGRLTVGSSRREQGRRSNESRRNVKLERSFYMGIKEVTNAEFRQFSPGHNSGQFKNYSLNQPGMPVVGVTWEQAALFCNWLSAKEGLAPAYILKGDELVAKLPLNSGYRLPTEVEWEYCTRMGKQGVKLKYPWGDKFPPGPKSGNFADESAKDLLSPYILGFNDGYAVTAPPATFSPNILGLYDLGGNVAEWCHDHYAIYSHDAKKLFIDPSGPAEGRHHVIRGSSWRQASISNLRAAYRDYSDDKRPDVGFRVARYER